MRPIDLNPKTSVNLTTRRHVGRQGKTPNIIVIHTAEAAETPRTAENLGNYFKTVDASTHWSCDKDSRVRSVEDKDTSWTAPGAANRSLNIELAGYARQTKDDWADVFSINMLEIAALSAAEWCIKYNIPTIKLTNDQIRNGVKGFAGHVDINAVYKKSTHWDPGPNFPWTYFLGRVKLYVEALGLGLGSSKPLPEKPAIPSWNNEGFSQSHIKSTQVLLNKLGARLAEDGRRGPATTSEIKAFQKAHDLVIDGLPDVKTTAKLKEQVAIVAPAKPSGKDFTSLQKAVQAMQDNIWGVDTDKRFNAVREASVWGGRKFTHGVEYTQRVVGANPDGVWGGASVKAHDTTTARIQKALLLLGYSPGKIDGVWGSGTEKAYQAARKEFRG